MFWAAVAAVAIPAAVAPATESGDMAVGGGQVVFDPQTANPDGPGTTITFSARQLPGDGFAAEGEVQEVDRSAAQQGRGASVFHGEVFCLAVQGNTAFIGYRPRQENAPDDEFHQLLVMDNGEGPQADVIILDRNPAGDPCVSLLGTRSGTLARGDVQVFDN